VAESSLESVPYVSKSSHWCPVTFDILLFGASRCRPRGRCLWDRCRNLRAAAVGGLFGEGYEKGRPVLLHRLDRQAAYSVGLLEGVALHLFEVVLGFWV
jgi:hypothetical protein